ncbi:MAG: hypothetical protein RI958_1620 [Actinomycetota bacterium]|jgi:glycosyltransferase involved in cell wall biosynthesis
MHGKTETPDAGKPDVTVVIPALDASSTLAVQLLALARQVDAPPFSVIVVDNGSQDATAAVALSCNSDQLSVSVVHEPNRGINRARNAGIEAASGSTILLCDADDRVGDAWVRELAANVSDHTWAVGCALVVPRPGQPIEPLWRHGQLIRPDCKEPYFDNTLGGSCGFSKAMWRHIGGFNPQLNGPGDEHEFFMRAHGSGYRPVVVDAAVIEYVRPSERHIWLRLQYTKGVHNSIAARAEGGTALRLICRPATVIRLMLRTVLSTPRYIRNSEDRWRWLGRLNMLTGRLVGWIRY